MNKKNIINPLPINVINKLISSSIINKPSYIVKELIENSCDAKSKNISIYTENNGFDLIRIVDDGCGIYKNELEKACQQYTTSKIKDISDLQNIKTYGFKGESLYLIKKISNLEIISKPKDQEKAYKITFNGETEYKIEEYPSNNGTEVIIKNLKLDITHVNKNNISFITKIMALSNFDIQFNLYKNSKLEKILPICTTKYTAARRIEELICKKCLNNSIDINYETLEAKIWGFLNIYNKKDKSCNFQYVFLNNRYISSKQINEIIKRISNKYLNKTINMNYCIYLHLNPDKFNISSYSKTQPFFFNINELTNFLDHAFKTQINISRNIIKAKENNTKYIANINEEKMFYILNNNISKEMIYIPKNQILTILNDQILFFEIDKKVYTINLIKLRSKIIYDECIEQITKFNKIICRKLNYPKFISIKNNNKILIYKNEFIKYGFELDTFLNEQILIHAAPEVLFNLQINWKKLILDMTTFLDTNISVFFSLNRFNIKLIDIFVKNIYINSKCLNFEIEKFYKTLSNLYRTEKKWFQKNCFEVYYKKHCIL